MHAPVLNQRSQASVNVVRPAALGALLLVASFSAAQSPRITQDPSMAYTMAPYGNAWRTKILEAGKPHADAYAKLLDAFDGDRARLEIERAQRPSGTQPRGGLQQGDLEKLASWQKALAAQYYDAGAVFYRNGQLDPKNAQFWNTVGDRAVVFYRDAYVIPHKGVVPGYQNFTDGLYLHYLRMQETSRGTTGESRAATQRQMEASRSAIVLLANGAAFARDTTPEDTRDPMLSREVAYAIRSMIHAEAVGEPRRERLQKLVNDALHHLDVLLPKALPPLSAELPFTRPFMVGITARALIDYAQTTNDNRILPALDSAQERLWRRMWNDDAKSFLYSNRAFPGEQPADEDMKPAPDLNLMIAPLYAWVGSKKNDGDTLKRADTILLGGIQQAYWAGAKQYNQQGWWSFDGITYRAGLIDPRIRPTRK